ncbi:hypothetical protein KIN20_004515 [Parelaphostrongylus tenuis]|uniref:Uncharacterized protein n=1 Tax=Parelaphostrongylus tenuis TaxID=148309 RepID=A0AAD5MH45_PARTN|nr:hypothetical protein KIN20_004515 [Parelaphostrongylus tenuis]
MPVIILSDKYNVTRYDIEQIARLDTIDNEVWYLHLLHKQMKTPLQLNARWYIN